MTITNNNNNNSEKKNKNNNNISNNNKIRSLGKISLKEANGQLSLSLFSLITLSKSLDAPPPPGILF